PWGEDPPTPELAGFGGTLVHAAAVGSYPAGAGPFGTLDQAGNVSEWCADRLPLRFLQTQPVPVAYTEKVDPLPNCALRGGSWNYDAYFLAAAYRDMEGAKTISGFMGFRCALAVP